MRKIQNMVQSFRPKIQLKSFFISKLNVETKTGLAAAARLLLKSIVLKYSVIVFWPTKLVIYQKLCVFHINIAKDRRNFISRKLSVEPEVKLAHT